MFEKKLDIYTTDGFRLRAIISMPSLTKKIVIMCHGISSHKQEYLDMFPHLAKRLCDHNVASIRFDYRGHGESSGTSLDFSVTSQLIDLESVVNWLKKQNDFKNIPLSYVGVSFGGAPGIIHHYFYSTFQNISLFAPVLSYKETFVNPTTDWGKENFNLQAWQESISNGFLLLDGEFKVSRKLLYDFLLIDPISFLVQLNIPVQIFHGTNDTLVPCSVAEHLSKQTPYVDVNIIENMGHGLFVDGDDDGITNKSLSIQQNYFDKTVTFLV